MSVRETQSLYLRCTIQSKDERSPGFHHTGEKLYYMSSYHVVQYGQDFVRDASFQSFGPHNKSEYHEKRSVSLDGFSRKRKDSFQQLENSFMHKVTAA